MTVDLTKLVLYTPDNAFKNVNRYSGSLTFPTTIPASSTTLITTVFSLTDTPVYTEFFANFLELNEATSTYGTAYGTTPVRWYSGNVAGQFGIALHETAPASTWINVGIYPTIVGNTVTITGAVFNGSGSVLTVNALTVPFVFIEYTLAA